MKMIHLGMVYIYKIPAKKSLSHNFIVNLQMYGTFLETRTWSPNVSR